MLISGRHIAMKKIKYIKYIIIAVGIVVSAAFYVLSGDAFSGNDSEGGIIIAGEALSEDCSVTGGGKIAADSGADAETPGDFPGNASDNKEAQTDDTSYTAYGQGGIEVNAFSSDAEEKLRALIKAAVREELMAVCEEGYLEQALKESTELAAAEAERKAGLININTADKSELMKLDGIGEKRANDIINYREQSGAFASPQDIMKVNGIKQSSYDKIKDKICT